MLCRLVGRSNADLQRVIDRMGGFDGIVRASTTITLENPVPLRITPLERQASRQAPYGPPTAGGPALREDREVTFWEYLGTRCRQLLVGAYQHAGAVFPCMVVATVLGVLIGVLTYRTEWAGNLAITMSASILTVPSLALLGALLRHHRPAHAGAGARLRTDGRHGADHGLAGDARFELLLRPRGLEVD